MTVVIGTISWHGFLWWLQSSNRRDECRVLLTVRTILGLLFSAHTSTSLTSSHPFQAAEHVKFNFQVGEMVNRRLHGPAPRQTTQFYTSSKFLRISDVTFRWSIRSASFDTINYRRRPDVSSCWCHINSDDVTAFNSPTDYRRWLETPMFCFVCYSYFFLNFFTASKVLQNCRGARIIFANREKVLKWI